MSQSTLPKQAFPFLNKLGRNNNREWFNDHKPEFKAIESDVKMFFAELMEALNQHDNIENMKVFRIYRDVRFSKDKTPYNTHFSCSYHRATAALRGGYYLKLKPGETFVGGGFWQPNKEDLYRIRKEFEIDDKPIRKILASKSFNSYFGKLEGDELKTAPRDFNKEHEAIDLIRKKSFIVSRRFTDKEVQQPDFLMEVNNTFKAMRPFFDYMSEVVTTNLNGESLLSL